MNWLCLQLNIYLYKSWQFAYCIISWAVFRGVIEVAENGERYAQETYHQIRDGQVLKKQLNAGPTASPLEDGYNSCHKAITNTTNYCHNSYLLEGKTKIQIHVNSWYKKYQQPYNSY